MITKKIHLWLSIPFGVIISLICISGASLVFESEITQLLYHDTYFVKAENGTPISRDSLVAIASKTLPDSVTITSVTIFNDPNRTVRLNLSQPRKAALFIDPYTGEITGRNERPAFFKNMMLLHRWLLAGNSPRDKRVMPGKIIVGISTIAFICILISGLILWFRIARKNLHAALTIKLHKNTHSLLFSLHNAAGAYVTLFLMLMALTGLTWSFDWYHHAFYLLFGEDSAKIVYNVHTGGFAGTCTKILWFISALIGATLPWTGYYLWCKRLRHRR